MDPDHKRMSRMLGYCLTLGDADAWLRFSVAAAARLTVSERAGLAYAALASLPADVREDTAATALRAAGSPLPPFLGGMDDARFWASIAHRRELKTHAVAAFERLSAKDRAAFLKHVNEMEAAA